MAYFTFEGRNCYYEELGDGRPLLLLHGNTASSNMFAQLAPAYLPEHRVILLDFLGHGRSDRLEAFPADLWYYEAQQVIAFLRQKGYEKVDLIGCSGGAMVAINVALEAPELVSKVIADSFEGDHAREDFTRNLIEDRAASKQDEGARMFYAYMHGDDWEQVVDCDTAALIAHAQTIGAFFHRPLQELQAKILLTGSKEDEFTALFSPTFFEDVYGDLIQKIGHGSMHLFHTGGHPAMLSNGEAFLSLSKAFLAEP